MKRRQRITKAFNNQTNAMPIPGRMKIGIGSNNKRYRQPPEPTSECKYVEYYCAPAVPVCITIPMVLTIILVVLNIIQT